jgi:hypothetical protein
MTEGEMFFKLYERGHGVKKKYLLCNKIKKIKIFNYLTQANRPLRCELEREIKKNFSVQNKILRRADDV